MDIKFRVWMNGEMHDDIVLVWDYPKHLDIGAPLNAGIRNFIRNGEGKSVLMLCIGIKDKNGKDVYDSDIVAYNDHDRGIIEYGGQWGHCGFGITLLTLRNNIDTGMGWEDLNKRWEELGHLEIIGNKYENPGLLEGE